MSNFEWLSLIGVLLGGFWVLASKLSAIEKSLVGKVGFNDCDKRRENCPCFKDIERIEKQLKK